MKRFFVLASLFVAGQTVFAQTPQSGEIMRTYVLDSVVVTSTRAGATTPMAFKTLKKSDIETRNTGIDMPFLLQFTPSVVVTSDAGAGIGYTGIRIRGTDATRINVTANGVPMNDAESHGLYWVNTPDFASSLDDIQVQRGVGTSTNGAGAFGGSINMCTEPVSHRAFGEVAASYGSYNTHRQTVRFGTGMLGGRWAFDARLSNIHSDGYRDRASTDLKSYFAQGAYYAKNTLIRFITFAGKEETYHAWDGVTIGQIDTIGRRFNPCGEIKDAAGKSAGIFYKNQTDNYIQSNYQLQVLQEFGPHWSLGATLHYTKGDGYYEEYKNARTLKEYGLKPFTVVMEIDGVRKDSLFKKSDLVRRKMMDNHFGGGIFSLDYKTDRLQASLGGAANVYDGDHFGRVIWIKNYANDPAFRPDHEYYDNNGTKRDANLYLKANWEAAEGLFLYGDVQYRHIGYRIEGRNDKWDWAANNYAGEMQRLDIDKRFDFFNPKAGVFYKLNDRFNVYGSVAVAHREPARNNYTDARTDQIPRAERLTDFELGGNYSTDILTAGVNFYYMKYKDQFILTGELNHIGEPIAENVPDSYRAGVEAIAGVRIAPWLRWDVNATLSRNRIRNYTAFLDNVDADDESLDTQTSEFIGNTDISFSPTVTAASLISADYRGFSVSLQTHYVGKQFVTNSKVDELSLKQYCFSNLRLGYTFKLPSVRSVSVGVTVYNIFNAKYSSNGYGGSTIQEGTGIKKHSMFYFPQAPVNVLASVVVRF